MSARTPVVTPGTMTARERTAATIKNRMITVRFEKTDEGFVCRNGADTEGRITCGPRTALTRDGQLLCTYGLVSKLGINDFVGVLSRSNDGGRTWTHDGPMWPQWREQYSHHAAISAASTGEHYCLIMRTPIDEPGEPFWCESSAGLKQNELLWSRSTDDGRRWSPPRVIPLHAPCSVEAPGTMCITRRGDFFAPYAPYNSFDITNVKRNHVVVARSGDGGRTWSHASMLGFDEGCGGGESWVIELTDDRLLATSWRMSTDGKRDHPNAFAISEDGGHTWQPTGSTATMGQSTALTTLPDGRALFIYNDRKSDRPGVRAAVCRPTATDFGIEHDQLVWAAAKPTQSDSSSEHAEWTDFSFGEPSATVLPDQTLFVALWSLQQDAGGIAYVKVKIVP